MIVAQSCGAGSTRGRNRLSSPVCRDFRNGHRTLYPPMVALPICPSPSQSAVSEYGWGSTSCGVVSTREVIVIVHVFGAVEILGIYESRMGLYLPRVRRKCPPLMGLYPSALGLEPISD